MLANCSSRLSPCADVAGIDAVLGQRLGAGRMVGQQLVAVVVEVADQRHVDAHARRAARGCAAPAAAASRRVDGDAHQLGAGDAPAPAPGRRCRSHPRCRCWSSTARRPARRRRSVTTREPHAPRAWRERRGLGDAGSIRQAGLHHVVTSTALDFETGDVVLGDRAPVDTPCRATCASALPIDARRSGGVPSRSTVAARPAAACDASATTPCASFTSTQDAAPVRSMSDAAGAGCVGHCGAATGLGPALGTAAPRAGGGPWSRLDGAASRPLAAGGARRARVRGRRPAPTRALSQRLVTGVGRLVVRMRRVRAASRPAHTSSSRTPPGRPACSSDPASGGLEPVAAARGRRADGRLRRRVEPGRRRAGAPAPAAGRS